MVEVAVRAKIANIKWEDKSAEEKTTEVAREIRKELLEAPPTYPRYVAYSSEKTLTLCGNTIHSNFDIYIYICIYIYIYIYMYIYTGWRKKKLTCLIYFNLKTKRAIRPKLRAVHSVLFNLNFDIRPVQFRAILTERAAFKLE